MTDANAQRTPARTKPNVVKRQAQELLELWEGIILLPLIGTQVERDIIDEKRRDGIAAARAKGTGRPRLVNDKLLIEALTLKEAASRCLRSLAD